jgi:ABC-type lipoprotein export system ATPase subunit
MKGKIWMLTLIGVTHIYPNGTRALDQASLEISKGMFGLLGPNGSGKSTLMRCIATLQTPSQGSIRFGDIDVIRQPEVIRATLGYLPQDFGVYPRVSTLDLLDHLAVLKGIGGKRERKETVESLLEQVNLWSVRKKPVAGFSGGMRQRFGIAQALIGRPQLIIVDGERKVEARKIVLQLRKLSRPDDGNDRHRARAKPCQRDLRHASAGLIRHRFDGRDDTVGPLLLGHENLHRVAVHAALLGRAVAVILSGQHAVG